MGVGPSVVFIEYRHEYITFSLDPSTPFSLCVERLVWQQAYSTYTMGVQGFFVAMLAIAASAVTASSRLDIIDLPTGFAPEGITLAEEWTVYVGSFSDSKSNVLHSLRGHVGPLAEPLRTNIQ